MDDIEEEEAPFDLSVVAARGCCHKLSGDSKFDRLGRENISAVKNDELIVGSEGIDDETLQTKSALEMPIGHHPEPVCDEAIQNRTSTIVSIGCSVLNWWKDESITGGSYYRGKVKEYDEKTGKVLIEYEDGDVEWENPKDSGFVYNPIMTPKYPLNAVFFFQEGSNRSVGKISRFDGRNYHVYYPNTASSRVHAESELDGNSFEFLSA